MTDWTLQPVQGMNDTSKGDPPICEREHLQCTCDYTLLKSVHASVEFIHFGTWGVTFCFSNPEGVQFLSWGGEHSSFCSGVPAPVQMGSSSPWLAFHVEVEVWGSSVPGIQLKNMGKKPRLLPVREGGCFCLSNWGTSGSVRWPWTATSFLKPTSGPGGFRHGCWATAQCPHPASSPGVVWRASGHRRKCEPAHSAGAGAGPVQQWFCDTLLPQQLPPTSLSRCSPAHWQLPEPPWNVTLHHPSPGDKHSLFTALQSPT